ncbi:S8 family serine peptidase [Colwellia sp. MB3u-70]|uniref:S8 family serine peptidase n=1 Tax=unclassified Colwellia TaxID=196834 RepID=UPI0015F44999|nr:MULTISPECIES: S8 family serine peptidase [unclassified Colwellia]MBA6293051.1 S8 family serine peptidase [Colwellia sp. MB3u-8]MBA6306628.1 S8 family serine peptidase [Colwellia sp. MB3u-70]
MKNKVALAVSTAIMTASLSSMASINDARQMIASTAHSKSAVNSPVAKKFFFEADLAKGQYTYIVRLNDMALATYDGSIAGLAATNPKIAKKDLYAKLAKSKMSSQQVRDALRLDTKSKEAIQYANFLETKQQDFLTQASSKIGKKAEVVYRYKNALNGMALRLTQAQAAKLSRLSSVAFVERERMEQMDTDTGPIHIGATTVWEGEGPSAINMGEGVIIGVIDSGINSDHASFADVGGDGYDHINPWGAGVYVGDCAGDFASMCNDKLIGVRSYSVITDLYDDTAVFGDMPPAKNGEDYGGHGSHTASTAGGNIIKNAPLVSGESGVAESDGVVNETFSFDQISGVAPHANIVAYQICRPGDQGDTYSGCPGAAIIAALDDAITDGVDVLNYSISGGGDPWTSSTELGFLAAQETGIFSAVSAGNSGSDAYTTPKNAPWYTVVGASTHGRTLDTFVKFNESNYVFTAGTGPVFDETVTALAISSKSIDAANFEGCSAFAADAFKDAIALISRGTCAFADKVTNATDAGAAAVIVYNNKDGDASITMSGLENTTIPSVAISQNSGIALLAELAENPTVTMSIDPAITLNVGQADDMAEFSSRGPNNTVADIMTPSVTAPGVSIYAAYSDQQFGHDVTGTAPTDYAFLQGTSMSAPHTAGAGAVLKSAHPTWTPDNIRSALMLTAVTDVRKEDGETAADVFDMGSGSIRVNLATDTGLIMDETFANYMKANPAVAGVPSSLNIPSMTNTKCIDTCSWTRTFTATKDANWTVTANTPTTAPVAPSTTPVPNDMALTVTPTSFDIKAGETQTITVTADVSEAEVNAWNFGDVTLTSEAIPSARLPVMVQVSGNNLPAEASVVANRADGSITYTGLKAKDLTGTVTASTYEAKVIEERTLAVTDGDYDLFSITFDAIMPLAVFSMSSDEALDADLEIYNGNFTYLGGSFSSSSNEMVSLTDLPAGDYWVVARAYTPSAPGATDAVDVKVSTTQLVDGSISEVVTTSVIQSDADFDLTLSWTGAENTAGLIELKDADSNIVLPWSITLGEPDVVESVSDELENGVQTMTPGEAHPVAFNIAPNFTNSDKVYTLVAEVTSGQEIANVNNDGVVADNTVTWTITRAVGMSTEMLSVGFDLIPRTASMDNEVRLTNTLGSDTIESVYTFGVVEVAPVALITGLSTTTEGSSVTVDGSTSSDANADALTYSWVQLSGTPVGFDASAASFTFVAPKVSKDETVSFQLTVNDGNGNTNATVASASIVNKKESGSFGWLMLLLTPMLFTRRKKV